MALGNAAYAQDYIHYQNVGPRDGIQSLMGSNPSRQEIINAHPNAHRMVKGGNQTQTDGGTLFNLPAAKGRKEWTEVDATQAALAGTDVRRAALVRGDFVFSYEKIEYPVIKDMVFEYAKAGVNVLQVFHGMNDPEMMRGAAQAIREARAEGYDIDMDGAICIEDNPNITVESCLEMARALKDMGASSFYLKSASGVVSPEFVREAVAAISDEFPDMDMGLHIHETYGASEACYTAAARERVKRRMHITLDVAHPALSGSTAHASILDIQSAFETDPLLAAHVPELDYDAIQADAKALGELRFRYREFETRYNKVLFELMKAVRAAGGASSTLKSIDGLKATVEGQLGTTNWDEVQIAIYAMQTYVDDLLGNPTQVTPYAANTTAQASIWIAPAIMYYNAQRKDGAAPFVEVYNALETQEDKAMFLLQVFGEYVESPKPKGIFGGAANYMASKHGKMSDTIDPALQKQAIEQVESMDRKKQEYLEDHGLLDRSAYDIAELELKEAALAARQELIAKKQQSTDPDHRAALSEALRKTTNFLLNGFTDEQERIRCLSSIIMQKKGYDDKKPAKHVMACLNGTNVPQKKPDLPYYAQPMQSTGEPSPVIAALGGVETLHLMARSMEHARKVADGNASPLRPLPKSAPTDKEYGALKTPEDVVAWLQSIPQKLQDAGLTPAHVSVATEGFKKANTVPMVENILRDIFEKRSEGLYDYALARAADYNAANDMTFAASHLAAEEAVA